MIGTCKNCIFYRSDNGYRFGECDQMKTRTDEEIGLMPNPDKKIDEATGRCKDGDYIKPWTIPNPNSTIVIDKMILFNGGGYDEFNVGEDFGCIHFKQK